MFTLLEDENIDVTMSKYTDTAYARVANIATENTDANTALHYLARNYDNMNNVDDNMAKSCIKLFIDKGADINAKNISGMLLSVPLRLTPNLAETPLHNACWKGCASFVDALLSYEADPNILNVSNEPPLYW